MEFQVLGPLQVRAEGVRLDLGGPKQRAVLALLLANAGQPVSTERLIEGAYGDGAPDAARRSVQTFVSKLRGQMGEMISSSGRGYEFTLVDSSVDSVEFAALLESARRLIVDDPVAAGEALRAALALWRGHPYQDVDAMGLLDAEITRLTDLRLVALELRIDADLAAGYHRELVGELEALTAEHPFQERFYAQRMLALYRSGRQAEALRAYQRMREMLAEELGIDPSPSLRDLELRILEQDPTLQLETSSLVGRRVLLVADLGVAALHDLAEPETRTTALHDVDRVIGAAIANHAGELAAQEATASYALFDGIRPAAEAAAAIVGAAPRVNGAPIVKVALDVGEIEQRSDGTVGGPIVIRAAGLVAAAHPGQVLLSADGHAAAGADATAGLVTRSLGVHAIPRLERAEPVHQIVVPDVPSEFGPLNTGGQAPALPESRLGVPGYELRHEIGRGVFGTVYRAYQPSVGREVAVKVVNPEIANDTGFIRRFAVEAQMIARIEHPHVVPIYDYWRGPNRAMLVMRLMRGGNLTQRAASSSLGRDEIVRLVDHIASALSAAHERGIVHGDVRPANVLLNESNDFFLGDLGVAAVAAAPEGDISPRSDVAAFAVMIRRLANPEALPEAAHGVLAAAAARHFGDAGAFLAAWHEAIGEEPVVPYTPTRNPYKGLAAFGEPDAADFKGRDAAIKQLVDAAAVNRLVAVVGPSGIGKSSVVRAGLVPALRTGAVNGSHDWLIAEFSPGSHPFERLAAALYGVAASAPHDLETLLSGDERGLIEIVERYLPDGAPLLLVIDQFEELFTLTDDEIERTRFLETLTATVREPASSVRLVLTLRADFFDRPLAHAEFGRLLEAATVPLAAPSDDELQAVITEPAGALGVEFEPGVVDRMIDDVAGESGALPLLEFTLTELFDVRDADVITQAAYDASGGVTAALGRRAEEIFDGLDAAQRLVARQVLLRLVTPGEGGRDSRRRVRIGELRRLGFDRAALDDVLTRFGEGRLLTFDRDSSTRGPTVEVAHEALLAEWPRMREWLDIHREELLLRSRLGVAAADWERSGRSDDYLLQAGRLAQHEAWTAATQLPLSRDEKDLLERSRSAAEEAATRRRRVRRWVTGGFATAAVVALLLAAFALDSGREADRQREQAEAATARAEQEAAAAATERDRAQTNAARADAAAAEATAERERAEGRALLAAVPDALESDPQTALLLAVEASRRLEGDPAAIAALHDSIAAARTVFETTWPVEMPTAGDLSPDGTLLAVAGRLGSTFEVHDIDAGDLAWRHEFDSTDLVIVPKFVNAGTELFVSVGWTPLLEQALDSPPPDVGFHVFDPATGAPLRRIDSSRCGPIGEERFVSAVYEASDRYALVHEIAPATYDEFGCRHPESGLVLDAFRIDSVTGERIQVVDGWEVEPDRPSALLTGMSADGRFVIVAPGGFPPPEPQGDAPVIEVDSGATVGLIDATVHGPLALSPDGSVAAARNLAAQGDFNTTNGLLRFNDVAAGLPLVETVTPEADVGLIHPAFTADGRRMMATYADGAVRMFDVTSGQQIDVVTGPGPAVLFARLTPDGRRMAMFTAGPTVRVVTLDLAEVAEAGIFEHCGDAPTRDHFYFNRAIVAHDPYVTINATCDGQATPAQSATYDLESGELVATRPTTGQAWAVGAGNIAALQTWRQDGDDFVAGEMVVQDLISGEVLTTLDGVCAWLWPDGESCIDGQQSLDIFNSDLAMSNDGNVVAVVGRDRPGRAWNLGNGARGELAGENDAVAISPDGNRLVTSNSGTGVMRLYSTDDFGLIGELTFAEPFAVRALQFTPDGTELVGADEDVLFHDPETLEITRRLIAPHDVVRDLDFSDDGSLIATGGADGFARVWDLASGVLVHEIALDDRIQAVAFVGNDTRLAVSTVAGPVRVFLLDVDELRRLAGGRLIRGFTAAECRAYFPDGECPSLEDVRSP
jgi:DNA-binding SARP family transcriptional activator/WD40 repeat protein